MRSMTGFGSSAVEEQGVALRAEVRAVNHRHLQLKLRLPPEFTHVEPDVEELVRAQLERGAVSVNVFLSATGAAMDVEVDAAAAARYHRELVKLAKELGMSPEVSLDTLCALPGVVGSRVGAKELAREARLLLKVVGAALDDLGAMREREGRALAKDLAKHAASIARVVKQVEKRMPAVVREHQRALEKRVEELLGGRFQLQPADLAREVALLADKLDVSEELARLKSHLAQLEQLLARQGPVGRQLDFLVQELLREANTIGSKCSDAAVAHAVVEAKTHIERLREQVQNVE
jgi:uncharacterized protein (TIGR00255 family)